jgi:hypothetical protein
VTAEFVGYRVTSHFKYALRIDDGVQDLSQYPLGDAPHLTHCGQIRSLVYLSRRCEFHPGSTTVTSA